MSPRRSFPRSPLRTILSSGLPVSSLDFAYSTAYCQGMGFSRARGRCSQAGWIRYYCMKARKRGDKRVRCGGKLLADPKRGVGYLFDEHSHFCETAVCNDGEWTWMSTTDLVQGLVVSDALVALRPVHLDELDSLLRGRGNLASDAPDPVHIVTTPRASFAEQEQEIAARYSPAFLALVRCIVQVYVTRIRARQMTRTHALALFQIAFECGLRGAVVDAMNARDARSVTRQRRKLIDVTFQLPLPIRYDPAKFLDWCGALETEYNIVPYRTFFFPTAGTVGMEDLDDRRVFRFLSLRRSLVRMREAALTSDFATVGALLGRVEVAVSALSRVYKSLSGIRERTKRSVRDFLVTLWHAGLQRILVEHEDPQLIVASVMSFLPRVVAATIRLPCAHFGSVHRNVSSLFCVDALLLCLAFDHLDSVEDLIHYHSTFTIRQLDPEYAQIFNAYAALARYQRLRGNAKNATIADDPTMLIVSLADACAMLPHAGDACVFLDALIHLLVITEQHEKALDFAMRVAEQAPGSTSAIGNMLRGQGLIGQAEQLLARMCDEDEDLLHEADACWLQWAADRVLHPQLHGPVEIVLLETARHLIPFLDYQSNAGNPRAWALLWASLTQLRDVNAVRSLYIGERARWWPRMHLGGRFPLGDEQAEEYRSSVMQLLNDLA